MVNSQDVNSGTPFILRIMSDGQRVYAEVELDESQVQETISEAGTGKPLALKTKPTVEKKPALPDPGTSPGSQPPQSLDKTLPPGPEASA